MSGLKAGFFSFVAAGVMDKVVSIKGINSGRGSFKQVSSQIYTKFSRKLISRISFKTFSKMFTYEMYNSSLEFIIQSIFG